MGRKTADRVNPNLKKREIVLDPACGTGGCLTASITHFEGQVSKKSGAKDHKAIADCIRGFERKQLPHLLCVTNMLLHGIEVPSMIERRNSPYTGIKTNLLFFTKGKPTETIWFYEHRYPEGQKSYSKTRPLRFEEFEPLRAWWGNESDGFKDRVETEQAWTYQFKQEKDKAEAKAKPHWDKAEQLKNEADVINGAVVEMRAAIKKESNATAKKTLQKELDEKQTRYDSLIQQAKDEQANGDRHFWPVFNLDKENENAPKEASHDPDKLLNMYDNLMKEIEATEDQLQSELARAMAHTGAAQ